MDRRTMGPLKGLKVIEIAGIGPGPFCAMMLSDMGAEVLRIDRPQSVKGDDPAVPPLDFLARGRRSVGLDLKNPEGVELLLKLVESADAILEGFRPGVMERIGIGPDVCLARNPRIVYGRITGWGQEGPLAHAAGHDINYIALAGALHPIGRRGQPPTVPLNLVGDMGGGGLVLAYGVVCALLECAKSGKGQVVDAAMVDGSATLASAIYAMYAKGLYRDERESNGFDGGSHYARAYETKDGKYISIVSMEPQFYSLLIEKLELDEAHFSEQMNRERWPEYARELQTIFKTRTRDEWCEVLEGTDVCFAPVLSLAEAPDHPHNVARGTFTEIAGVVQPRPAPRFSRSDSSIERPPPHAGQHTDEVLAEIGLDADAIDQMRESGAVA